MTPPEVAISRTRLPNINFKDTPQAAKELLDHPEKYRAEGRKTILNVSEEAAKEIESVGGVRLERSQ